MLAFACDRRYVIDGNYRIQMNELVIGIPLPSWMLFIGQSAIPVAFQTEVFLHAKAYTPKEAHAAGIFHGLLDSGADIDASLNNAINALMGLQRNAYATTKRWLREKKVQEVLVLLRNELPSK